MHDHWRDKRVHVVVATNASFGLGIDNPNVRYVVHHSLAKSLANFQQESGRAGRDGAPADCVTFWRAADASRLSSLTYETFHTGGKEKRASFRQLGTDLARPLTDDLLQSTKWSASPKTSALAARSCSPATLPTRTTRPSLTTPTTRRAAIATT